MVKLMVELDHQVWCLTQVEMGVRARQLLEDALEARVAMATEWLRFNHRKIKNSVT